MSKKYEIHSGRRVVSTQFSVSASQAVIDYVRSYGVKDDEIGGSEWTASPGGALSSRQCSFLRNPRERLDSTRPREQALGTSSHEPRPLAAPRSHRQRRRRDQRDGGFPARQPSRRHAGSPARSQSAFLAGGVTPRLAMTRKQRDVLRRQIDARIRERLNAMAPRGPRPTAYVRKARVKS